MMNCSGQVGRFGRRRVLVALLSAFAFTAPGPLQADTPPLVDQILVVKHERKLYLQRNGQTLKWYWIALGSEPEGPKTVVGDGRTPEGVYFIEGRDEESDFYRSLWISYPNSKDRARARQMGANPGGDIVIHALPPGYGPIGAGERMIDWTQGCIAVTNADMDEIWDLVADGTPIVIRP